MKRLVFLIVALVGINALRAQDTIYPYDPQSPFFKDPIFSEFGGDTCWCPIDLQTLVLGIIRSTLKYMIIIFLFKV